MTNQKVEHHMQHMKNLFLRNPLRALTVIGLMLVLPLSGMMANAQVGTVDEAPTTEIQTVGDVFLLIYSVFNILFWLLILLAAIFIIMAAFAYLTAGGDPEKVKKANHRVIYAAVAVVVAVLARVIPSVVCSFLGADCSNPEQAADFSI